MRHRTTDPACHAHAPRSPLLPAPLLRYLDRRDRGRSCAPCMTARAWRVAGLDVLDVRLDDVDRSRAPRHARRTRS